MNRPDQHRARRIVLVSAVAAVLSGCTAGAPSAAPTPAGPSRQAEVAERGAAVMPFDLERTTHRFSKTDTGGVQTVVADQPQDTAQIDLIRGHLAEEVDRFRRGDFTDPGRIHGAEMPGLGALRAHGGRITIDYAPTPEGGRVTYVTGDAELRAALHHWFDAQVGDHGRHATG